MDATFSWYFRDEDRWFTVVCRRPQVSVRPGLAEEAEMRFYSASLADFIHQHATEGAGRAIFQGGGFFWRGDMAQLKAISPLCRDLFGTKLHQRLLGAGIAVPRFEARRYPARTKAQRDRIFAEWRTHGERPSVDADTPLAVPALTADAPISAPMRPVTVVTPKARVVTTPPAAPAPRVSAATSKRVKHPTAPPTAKAPTLTTGSKTAPVSASARTVRRA
jgi:hypothetical protein